MSKKKKPEKIIQKTVKHFPPGKIQHNHSATPTWALPFILILTFAAYIPALSAGYVNWDDGAYVNKNILIRDFSNFSELITKPVQGNYHPLTMISLAFNYMMSGMDAWSYHLFNIVFHLINTLLAFRLAMLLSHRNLVIGFTTAILFGIHPLHVESVAWISERKDVLYTIFFFAGLISYTKFIDTGSRKQFTLAILFLVFSLLSKPAAVIFPVALFCIDILRKRNINMKSFIEKIPFFIPALLLAILTYTAQSKVGATGEIIFPWSSRIFFATYGIMMYFLKLLIPLGLSPFYPYPTVNVSLPAAYLISPVISVLLAVLFFLSWKKDRVMAFGISFFIVNLALVLQLIPVGSAVMADRYAYLPAFGIFYILGWMLSKLKEFNFQKTLYIILPVSLIFAFLTYQQAGIWHDGKSLWDHVIKTNPNAKAYTLRATFYRQEGNLDKALEYYNTAIKLNPIDNDIYNNRGNIYFDQKKYDLAYADYMKSISLQPKQHNAYDNLGALLGVLGKSDSALYYLDIAIKMKPDYISAYKNRAITLTQIGRFDQAIKDYEFCLKYEPENAEFFNSIGYCLRLQNKYQEALTYIDKAIQMNPKPVFHLNRSFTYFGLNNPEQAKSDAQKARQGGITIDPGYARDIGLQ